MTTGALSHGYGSPAVTGAVAVARARWVEILTIVLAGAGVIEGLVSPTGPDGISKGPGWLIPLIAPAMALPLLFRERVPFAAPVATVAIALGATFLGLSNAEIAREAFASETTVKTHVARMLMKLRLRDRVQAVVFAYESGVVQPGG